MSRNTGSRESDSKIIALVKHFLSLKADKSEIPTAVSELTNDSGYQTAQDVQTAIDATVGDIETLLASI